VGSMRGESTSTPCKCATRLRYAPIFKSLNLFTFSLPLAHTRTFRTIASQLQWLQCGLQMLSDKQVRALKSVGKDKVIADGGGLYLRVSKHGTKTFVLRTRVGGNARYLTLGEYPALSLADARTKVGEIGGLTNITLGFAVKEYISHIEREYEDPAQVKRRLEADIVPKLGAKRLSSVSQADVTAALQEIVDRGSPVAANRTLADVKHVFQYAYGKGWVRNDPTVRITRKVTGGKEKSRDVVVTDKEVKELVEEMRKDRFELRTRVAVLVLLLTGQRASEVLGFSKNEVQGVWWTIPKERTKNGKEHKVYLTRPVRWLLAQSSLGGDHRTLSKAFRRMKLRYTPHDLRRLLSTRLSDKGTSPHIVEKMLNHQMEGVMSVYNHAEYLPERRTAWRLWTRHVLSCIHLRTH
jgi:integrase